MIWLQGEKNIAFFNAFIYLYILCYLIPEWIIKN